MAANVWGAVGENSICLYAVAISATVLTVVISTVYILRRFFHIRASPSASEDTKAQIHGSYTCRDNATIGNDGDATELNDEDDRPEGIPGQVSSPRYPDPVEYCEHIQGEFKRVQQSVATRTIEKSLTEQQLLEEREVQRRQLGEIFRLMQEQQERFGIGSMDDMQEQMKLYSM